MPHQCSCVLVTGGAGFIGSHVVEGLLSEEIRVVVLDNLHKGRLKNLRSHVGKSDFLFIKGDIRDSNIVKRAIKGVDGVIHLAALTSPAESFEKPSLYNEINITGTVNLLSASLDFDVKRFVFASSAAVYGNPKTLPIKEDTPLSPRSPYGISKMSAEAYVKLFFEEYGLKTVTLRYFNVYGPRQACNQYSGVITRFMSCLRENRSPIIYDDGKQTRDFVNVKDVVEASVLALKSSDASGIFNIGGGVPITIEELANTLLRIEGKTGLKVLHSKPQKGDIRHSVADVSRAREKLGYEPQISLEKGLRQFIASY